MPEDDSTTLIEMVRANQIDLAIVPGEHWGPPFVTVRICQVEDPWVASPAFRLPRRPLKPEEFERFTLLDQTGAAKNRIYDPWRAQHGFRFGKVYTTNSVPVLRQLTVAGYGICQLVLDYVRPDIKAGRLRIVRSDPMPPPMVYGAVYREDNLEVAVERIVELAKLCCDFSPRANG